MDRLDVDVDVDVVDAPSRTGEVPSSPRPRRLTCASLLTAAVSTAVIISGLNGLVQIIKVIVEVSAEHAR